MKCILNKYSLSKWILFLAKLKFYLLLSHLTFKILSHVLLTLYQHYLFHPLKLSKELITNNLASSFPIYFQPMLH